MNSMAKYKYIFLFVFTVLIAFVSWTVQAEQKTEIYAQIGHPAVGWSVSNDGNYVLSVGEGQDDVYKLWDTASGRLIKTISIPNKAEMPPYDPITFSSDGRYILTPVFKKNDKCELIIWDVLNDIKRSFISNKELPPLYALSFSPDNQYAMSSHQDQTIKLWDVSTGNELRSFSVKSNVMRFEAFSPDGKYFISKGFDKSLRLCDLSTGKDIHTFTGSVSSASFSPDNKHIILGNDKTLEVMDIISGKLLRSFTGHKDQIVSVAFSPDGNFVISSSADLRLVHPNSTVNIWSIASGKIERTYSVPGMFELSAKGRFGKARKFNDRSPQLWDAINGKVIQTFKGLTDTIGRIAISSDAKYAVALFLRNNGNIKLWDISNGNELWTLTGHTDSVRSIAFSSDSRYLVSGGNDSTLKIWDTVSGKMKRSLAGHSGYVEQLAFSPDDKYIVSSGHDKAIKLWDVSSGKEIRSYTGFKYTQNFALSPDGRYVLAWSHYDGDEIKIIDLVSGISVQTIEVGKSGYVRSGEFTPDGKRILINSGSKTKLFDVKSGKVVRDFPGYFDLQLSPDGKFTLSVQNKTMKVINFETGEEKTVFKGKVFDISSTAFSKNGKYLLTAGEGAIALWDVVNGKELSRYISFIDNEWLSITPEGYYTGSANADKNLNVRIGNKVYGIENYRESFFRPDLVKIALSGGSLKGYRNIANVKTPPQVKMVDTPQTVSSDELTVKLELADTGGGIGNVQLYLNGSAVKLDKTRGLKAFEKSVTRSYKIRLSRGDNIIRAVAFNAENTMQSNPAEQTVTATFTSTAKPTLHVLAIGINEFKNPKLRLQYAVPDADLFTETLKKGASDLFGKVNLVRLTTAEQTTSEYIANELKKLRSINADDTFILFVASHGTVDDGNYFLITSNVGSTSSAKLKTEALSQNRIKELIANIPATKKVIVLDTCNAGQMGDAIQVAMLTRGMSEDTAFKILSRAVGSTILSSASSTQEALEGYQGHGLFTWVLAEGMKGKADKGKSGYIKTIDLVDYVESEVPEIAERQFKRKQYPTSSVNGQGFPIAKSLM